MDETTAGAGSHIKLMATYQDIGDAAGSAWSLSAKNPGSGTGQQSGEFAIWVDGSRQIRAAESGGVDAFELYTSGWLDRRGRDD
jgi:hypothetical protein